MDLKTAYLDYVNNFISVQGFADHYEIKLCFAIEFLQLAKKIYEDSLIST